MGTRNLLSKVTVLAAALFGLLMLTAFGAVAQPVPGGTLDPLTIPKYVTPLVIPPVMNNSGAADVYDIAVREFFQQILPIPFNATKVWSYGPAADPVPALAPAAGSQFNYPAYTIETSSMAAVNVTWRNELVAIDPVTGFPYPAGSANRTFLPHVVPVDQTLHWANPPGPIDSMTTNPAPYLGPVPMVTHVHGAHVDPHSDGYPEAWWLPKASDIDCDGTMTPLDPSDDYFCSGSVYDDSLGGAGNRGLADYLYRNDQPATTLWYHDHTLGMTRVNVYAGPAGFWLIRGGPYDTVDNGTTPAPNDGVLPGPAPVYGEGVVPLNTPLDPVRNKIREIPIVIQDRSFNLDGSLFYPDTRAFFDGFAGPYIPDLVPNFADVFSDIAPIWNPEAFFNVMVANGVAWPTIQVAPALYRFRLLNGCNSRFLNLALFKTHPKKEKYNKELSFYQIGAEQGFLPQVVEVRTGFATPLPGNGVIPARLKAPNAQQALLLGLAERADVIVDFRGMTTGQVVRMVNTAPDWPFGGFPDIPSDPTTTGQVMEFVINSALLNAPGSTDMTATDPLSLVLNAELGFNLAVPAPNGIQKISLNEEESLTVCVDLLTNTVIPDVLPPLCGGLGVPAAPKAALLGRVDETVPTMPMGIPLRWTDDTGVSTPVPVTLQNGSTVLVKVTENPIEGDVQDWDIYNFTVDAHPIHLHLVRFQVASRTPIPGVVPAPVPVGVQKWETGFKDTVIAYPGEITRVRAKFDIPGLYVWHCHIVEHEDNEMMRPFVVSPLVP